MARFVDAIDLPLPPEQAFDLLADFGRLPEWDPGVVEAGRLGRGPIGRGSRFRVVSAVFGRRIPLTYEVIEHERPLRLVLRAREGAFTSLDEITFVPRAGGTRVTYDARLLLSGLARLADPLLQLAFGFLGRAAVRGLEARAAALAAEAPPSPPQRAASAG